MYVKTSIILPVIYSKKLTYFRHFLRGESVIAHPNSNGTTFFQLLLTLHSSNQETEMSHAENNTNIYDTYPQTTIHCSIKDLTAQAFNPFTEWR